MVGDGITPIAAAASVTERIRFGTAILPVFTRSPALLAMSAAGLQNLSGGRFILGVGISTPTIVQQWMDVPYEKPVTRLRETVEALRAIFSGQKVSMKGKTVAIDGFRLGAHMENPPPIYVGAQGELMLRTAGEVGDGTIVNFITPETFPQMLAHIREGARKAGKQTGAIEVACRIVFAIDQEEDVVREQLRRELTAYLTVPQYNKFFQWIGYEKEARTALTAWNAGDRKKALASVPDQMMESIFIYGTPDRWAKRLKDYEKAGITSTALQFTSYAKDPEEKRKRIMRAMEALSSAW
jgi:probable F420-dependent oxidoreductase